jgi:mono/diheme cytochrome c family protein
VRHAAYLALCLIAIGGCGASTAGSRHGTRPSGGQASAQAAASPPSALSIAPPAYVTRADASRLAEFELGRAVAEQSGCLACHRIGDKGPPQPGPALTHIGSMMPARSIEHVLIDAEPPMPSFRRLARPRFEALVRFLSLLRCPGHPRGLLPHGC